MTNKTASRDLGGGLLTRSRRRKGFTMVEMLLVVGMLSLITLAIYRSITNGIRVWERAYRFSIEEDVAIFLDKISADLRNLTVYSRIPFQGESTRLVLPTIVRTRVDSRIAKGDDVYTDQIGCVEYYFDAVRSGLFRKQANYGQALHRRYSPASALVTPVSSVHFFYVVLEQEHLVSYPRIDHIPLAVRVEIDFQDREGRPRRVTRNINIPLNQNYAS